MLISLCIKNFTIVSELELDFAQGMSVFTGETGAGKSIMIDALMLALGGRAEAEMVRPGADACDIQACFTYSPNSETAEWLSQHDVADAEEIILRRHITREGRSKAYINGVIFPLQKLKELSVTLVHIHGQHEQQTLFSSATHREQLDHFAQHTNLRKQVAKTYRLCQNLEAEQRVLIADPDHGQLQEDLTLWEEMNPLEGEIEALHQEHQMLHHAQDYALQTQALLEYLQEDEENSIQSHLHRCLQQVTHLPKHHATIQTIQGLIEQALILCEEAYDELQQFGQTISMDPERLQVVESRMSTLHQMARKWQIPVQDLAAQGHVLKQALEEQQQKEARKMQLVKEYEAAQKKVQELALELRASRMTHAHSLAQKITNNIKQLGMPHGFLELAITPLNTCHEHGMDKIEYRVTTNPGMPADLLTKIVSGGELSRISLAIQLIAAQQGSTSTLFFDEVDVGIGGNTAAIVGRLLRQLGSRLQVFCVTHQPQVAASAHHHFLVEKCNEHDQTYSKITSLRRPEEKIEELARMLGGLSITSHTRTHAKELLESLSVT